MEGLKIITTRQEFIRFKLAMRLRADWHEPDEQGIAARVEGDTFDNAGFWPATLGWTVVEQHVIFTRHDPDCADCPEDADGNVVVAKCPSTRDVAAVNLATLCAWATGLRDED